MLLIFDITTVMTLMVLYSHKCRVFVWLMICSLESYVYVDTISICILKVIQYAVLVSLSNFPIQHTGDMIVEITNAQHQLTLKCTTRTNASTPFGLNASSYVTTPLLTSLLLRMLIWVPNSNIPGQLFLFSALLFVLLVSHSCSLLKFSTSMSARVGIQLVALWFAVERLWFEHTFRYTRLWN